MIGLIENYYKLFIVLMFDYVEPNYRFGGNSVKSVVHLYRHHVHTFSKHHFLVEGTQNCNPKLQQILSETGCSKFVSEGE